jgi:phosphoglycolate phosphatase
MAGKYIWEDKYTFEINILLGGKMNYSHVLWDFNGTIIDDVQAGINSTNVLLARREMPTISGLDEYHEVFGFPIIGYYEKLGFDFSKESFEDLAIEWVEQYLKFVENSPLHNGIVEKLTEIKAAGIFQSVLSATELKMLTKQLTDLGIVDLFDEIMGLDNIHAHSKIDIGNEWLNRTKPFDVLLIGDSLHDLEVADELGFDCVLIAKGHQSKNTLMSHDVIVIDDVCEINVTSQGHLSFS